MYMLPGGSLRSIYLELTLIDLMYMCGGPTSNGSYQNIIVNRISKEQIGTAKNYPSPEENHCRFV